MNSNLSDKIRKNFFVTINWFKQNISIILSILLLVSIIQNTNIKKIFTLLKDDFLSVIISDLLWSILAGNPINSYLLIGELWNLEQNIIVATTFLISWITVGFIQIPAETYFFWKKFTIIRNVISFIFAILCSYLIYFLINFVW
jgi:hypothetical protein